jgi:hypothetical protein
VSFPSGFFRQSDSDFACFSHEVLALIEWINSVNIIEGDISWYCGGFIWKFHPDSAIYWYDFDFG